MKTLRPAPRPEDRLIAQAIRKAERRTSGEIRVFVSETESGDPSVEAAREFERLQMRRTPLRNAVLLHFSTASHRLTVIGDEGIHLRCGPRFWAAITRETDPLIPSVDRDRRRGDPPPLRPPFLGGHHPRNRSPHPIG